MPSLNFSQVDEQLQIFLAQTLTLGTFAAHWAVQMHSISFKSPDQGPLATCLVKSVAAVSRCVLLSQGTNILFLEMAFR